MQRLHGEPCFITLTAKAVTFSGEKRALLRGIALPKTSIRSLNLHFSSQGHFLDPIYCTVRHFAGVRPNANYPLGRLCFDDCLFCILFPLVLPRHFLSCPRNGRICP